MQRRSFLKWFASTAGVVLVSPGLIVPELVVPTHLGAMPLPTVHVSGLARTRILDELLRSYYLPVINAQVYPESPILTVLRAPVIGRRDVTP